MKSLEEFVKDSNSSDLRYDLLEKWIVRKEREIRHRDKLPPADFYKSDKMIYEEKEQKDSVRRREVLETIAQRKYNEITIDDLTRIVDKLCKRMYLFNGEYPQFIVDLVKEILQHPNITVTAKQVFHRT